MSPNGDWNFSLEETPDLSAKVVDEPISGHYHTCYVCGLGVQQAGVSNFDQKERKYEYKVKSNTENLVIKRKYVMTVCLWCVYNYCYPIESK